MLLSLGTRLWHYDGGPALPLAKRCPAPAKWYGNGYGVAFPAEDARIVSLTPGQSLGPYKVVTLLGEGGMGQVWQATDTQLNRQVALKILPDAFASDPDRLARFKREAQRTVMVLSADTFRKW